jgi:hypothetical protein
MRYILSLVLVLMLAPMAQAGCLFACDDTMLLPDAEARAILKGILGAPLPAGLTITAMREGGFQDEFYQTRMTGDVAALTALLAVGGLTMADLTTSPMDFGPKNTDWWDVKTHPDLRAAQMPSPTLPYAAIGIAPEDAGFVIYLWAFET